LVNYLTQSNQMSPARLHEPPVAPADLAERNVLVHDTLISRKNKNRRRSSVESLSIARKLWH